MKGRVPSKTGDRKPVKMTVKDTQMKEDGVKTRVDGQK